MTTSAKAAVIKTILNPVIAVGATESGEIDLRHQTPVGLQTPVDWDSTTVSFKGSTTLGGTYVPLYDGNGLLYSKSIGASQCIALDPAIFAQFVFMKIVAGTIVAGTNSTLSLIVRQV